MERASEILLQIVRGGTLNDKLAGSKLSFSELEWDLDPASALFISIQKTLIDLEMPGREGALHPNASVKTSTSAATGKGISGFPKRKDLAKSEAERGRLLHFFANHELLAIETMAFTLLKFPNAPLEFRKGLWKTLQDEQRHFGMYVERMQEYGVELGAVPFSLYFWNVLKTMQSPLDYVARMSLTFEQANLDFALEYAEMFEKEIDDAKTAALLRKVHDDEVNHVAHGVKWFEQWRDVNDSQWQSYEKLLPFPLTPRRARGAQFFAGESRLKSGMTADFVDQIRIAGGSRGKIPRYFYFNPQCELESAGVKLSPAVREKMSELAPLMLWLGKESDVVELPQMPSLAWLKQLHELKGELPEILVSSNLERFQAFENLSPWGWGPSAYAKESLINQVKDAPSRVRRPQNLKSETFVRKLFSKTWWKEQLGTAGMVIRDLESFHGWLPSASAHRYIFKSEVSTSGRGHRVWDFSVPLDHRNAIQDAVERLERKTPFVIEPFYEKRIDFSVQYEILADGTVKEFPARFFKVDSHLQYRGAFLGEWGAHSPLAQEWNCLQENKISWRAEHERVLQILKKSGYVGPLGIDALIEVTPSGLHVVAIVEVNVRYTMGRIAHEIESALRSRPNTHSVWAFLNKNDLARLGVQHFSKVSQAIQREIPDAKVFGTTEENTSGTWTAVISSRNPTHLLTVL